MNFQEYQQYFESILQTDPTQQKAPYDNPDYMDYTKLNGSRTNRWFKTAKLSEEIIQRVKQINEPRHWIIITEPWCGDAAHNIPIIEMIASHNPLIRTEYVLRDTEPFLINDYLTNGTKSIPKLIMRNADGQDIATWGPRPTDCQTMYAELMKEGADFETVKREIQNWYNANKAVDIQKELEAIIA